MDRRDFLKTGLAAGAVSFVPKLSQNLQTRHFVWIVNGNGSRKADWYENSSLSPNLSRIAREGFVYEESFNDTVARHGSCWTELVTGTPVRDTPVSSPTVLQHIRNVYEDRASNYWLLDGGGDLISAASSTGQLQSDERQRVLDFGEAVGQRERGSLTLLPEILKAFKPRMLIFHQADHDVAHGNGGYPRVESGYSEYLQVCKRTDEQIGKIFDFVKSDTYFSRTTAILVRPEFGRDDEVTRYGELHHSTGFYQSHHSAEIWWGPDFRSGVDKTLKNRLDVVPTIAGMFDVDISSSPGQVRTELFQ